MKTVAHHILKMLRITPKEIDKVFESSKRMADDTHMKLEDDP